MKLMTTKRSLTLLMALLMLLGVMLTAVSCAIQGDDPADTTGQSTESQETETELAYNNVPKQNYDRTFSILTRDDTLEQFEVEELTGDLLDDAIYERNATVANDFGRYRAQEQYLSYRTAKGKTWTSLSRHQDIHQAS